MPHWARANCIRVKAIQTPSLTLTRGLYAPLGPCKLYSCQSRGAFFFFFSLFNFLFAKHPRVAMPHAFEAALKRARQGNGRSPVPKKKARSSAGTPSSYQSSHASARSSTRQGAGSFSSARFNVDAANQLSQLEFHGSTRQDAEAPSRASTRSGAGLFQSARFDIDAGNQLSQLEFNVEPLPVSSAWAQSRDAAPNSQRIRQPTMSSQQGTPRALFEGRAHANTNGSGSLVQSYRPLPELGTSQAYSRLPNRSSRGSFQSSRFDVDASNQVSQLEFNATSSARPIPGKGTSRAGPPRIALQRRPLDPAHGLPVSVRPQGEAGTNSRRSPSKSPRRRQARLDDRLSQCQPPRVTPRTVLGPSRDVYTTHSRPRDGSEGHQHARVGLEPRGNAVGLAWALRQSNAPSPAALGLHETCPGKAVLLFHQSSGLLDQVEAPFSALASPSEEMLSKCVREFAEEMSLATARVGCAGCGRVCNEKDTKELTIGPEVAHLSRGAHFRSIYMRLSALGKLAHHVVKKNEVLYHVAPKLICNGAGRFCARCQVADEDSAAKMSHYRFKDCDYGVHFWEHNLPLHKPLSTLEELALSGVLPYVTTVKLRSNGGLASAFALKSHVFSLPHDGHDELGRRFLTRRVARSIMGGETYDASDLLNPLAPMALTYTFIGTGVAYSLLLRSYRSLLQGIAINPPTAAAFIAYHAEAGHPDFLKFRGKLPQGLADCIGPMLQTFQDHVVDAMELIDDPLTSVVESHMQAEGNGSSVVASDALSASSDRHFFAAAANFAPIGDEKKAAIQAAVSTSMVDEYRDNHVLYSSAFPGLFPLGVPGNQSGPFPQHVWQTCLLGYQSAFERSVNFVGMSGDAKMRRLRCISASLAVKSKEKFKEFEAMVSDQKGFYETMLNAVEQPTGERAKKAMKTLKPIFEMANRHVKWSRGERIRESSRINAMIQRYGPPSMMVTISPNATDEPLTVCIALRALGSEWKPRVLWEEKAAALRARRDLTEGAPATCAYFYNLFVKSAILHLFGVDIDRKGEQCHDSRVGIFGQCRAAHGVTEAQGRGHLHLHMLLWLLCGPLFFGRFLHDDDRRDEIVKYLDAVATAQLARAGSHYCPVLLTPQRLPLSPAPLTRMPSVALPSPLHPLLAA